MRSIRDASLDDLDRIFARETRAAADEARASGLSLVGLDRRGRLVVEVPGAETRELEPPVDSRTGGPSVADPDHVHHDRAIEAERRWEESVVSKEARVKEELVVKKDVERRTETVSDTVRRTEVTVQDRREAEQRSKGRRA